MEHRLVTGIEKALGWGGPGPVGTAFARGHLADPDLITRLMTPNRLLETIRHRHLANPQLRCYAEGDEVHPSLFLSTNVNRRRQAVNQADMAALGRILNSGGTVVLDHVDFFDPTLEVACRALGWWSGELTSANAYLAVGDTDGFNLHWDDHDVIAVQLSGEKSWEVRGPSRPAPMYRDAERNLAPSEEVLWRGTMQAGDVMHIPRGFWHTATRIGSGDDGHSLHVTFGLTKRTGVTWANFLSDAARADEDFRTDLERSDGTADGEVLAAKLTDLAREYDPKRYLAELRANTPPARHMPHIPVFGPLECVAAVTEFEPVITPSGDTVQVVGGGKRLTFHGRAEPGLRSLLSGHPVRLTHDDQDLIALAEHMIQEGLCAPLTAESLSAYTGLVTPDTF
ncbi:MULTISPECIES: JmjC domain-containing protein [Streptomyces]|uniref:JmjC domain-containing protein n=3 Tax=Streptomyces TaxID=1883 RepID=A0ABW9IY32_STRGJ|nr:MULTISPECIES: cupin domain-containing protein [Streptomyces]MBP5860495.1 cupin [Streptomyces sp. LBUM 1484]MBP5870534.1 cupin [Streptomyces sp. LBUM 1485]MBP5927985.1 cupin [Streptomyces sp. LBUM 1479]KFG09048.1 cupin [Streptomyces scabiei]MBP5879027.1 cupin [Streptomyces sp. LBUM 1477]